MEETVESIGPTRFDKGELSLYVKNIDHFKTNKIYRVGPHFPQIWQENGCAVSLWSFLQ